MAITIQLILIVSIILGTGPSRTGQAEQSGVRRAGASVEIDPRVRGSSMRSGSIRVPIESPEPFLAVGLRWKSSERGPTEESLSLRGSADGVEWTGWLPVRRDSDLDAPDDLRSGGLILLHRSTRFVQFAIDYGGLNGASIERVDLTFISPGGSSPEMERRIAEISRDKTGDEVQQMTTNYPKPPVVTRTDWGCPDGQVTTHGALSYTTVTHLIVHHTVNDNDSTDWPAVVRSIWNFHVFDRGYADIGYNYLVDPRGVIYEGRAGGDNVQGAHFSGVNTGTMGVALLGEFTVVEPTAAAISSLRKILAWKCDQRTIDPTGASLHDRSGLLLNNISGHRDGPSSTECPGGALYALLPAIRSEIKSMLGDTGALAAVSAASYSPTAIAPDSIVAVFGSELAAGVETAAAVPLPTYLGGAAALLRDSAGIERSCGLFFVSPAQVNLLVPPGTAPGPAELIFLNPDGKISSGSVTIERVAPGLFSANADGKGVAAAVVLRVKVDGSQIFEPVSSYDAAQQRFVSRPIAIGSDQVYLIVFGTGIRGRSSLAAVSAALGGISSEVLYAGPTPDFSGLDQINLRLAPSLAGRGVVDLVVSSDGRNANVLQIEIQ